MPTSAAATPAIGCVPLPQQRLPVPISRAAEPIGIGAGNKCRGSRNRADDLFAVFSNRH
jgi:hypothetical protein